MSPVKGKTEAVRKHRVVSKSGTSGACVPGEIESHGADAAKALQTEILYAYAQLSRSWLARVRSEAALWAELALRAATSGSLPEILEAHKECASHQLQMTVEDSQHLFEDCEIITRQIYELVSNSTAKAMVNQPVSRPPSK